MTRPLLGRLLLLGLAAGLGACASPQTRYYTLKEQPAGTPAGTLPGPAPARLGVYVADVTVPASADRQPLVVTDAGNIVTVEEFDQWASALDAQITRVMVGNLRQILGVSTVASDLDLVGNPRALRLRLVVERFDGKVSGSVMVRARWSIARGADGVPSVDSVSIERPVSGARIDDVVTAWNGALWEVSQAVARDLLAAKGS